RRAGRVGLRARRSDRSDLDPVHAYSAEGGAVMSLNINVKDVVAVKIKGDGWYDVVDQSFYVEELSFVEKYDGDTYVLMGPSGECMCDKGFSFETHRNTIVAGPMSMIVAVRMVES